MGSLPRESFATAAVNWIDSGGQVHIRVYSSDGNNITERCWDAGVWTTGSFTGAGDDVSATCWMGGEGLSIRVYCTLEGTTTEWCIDQGGGWYKGPYTAG